MKKISYIVNLNTLETIRAIGGLNETLYHEMATKLRKYDLRKAVFNNDIQYFTQCSGVGEKRARLFIDRAKAYFAERPEKIAVQPAHYFAKMVRLEDVRDAKETNLYWSIRKCKNVKELKKLLDNLSEYEEVKSKVPFAASKSTRITLPESMDEWNLGIKHYTESDVVMVFNHKVDKFVELNHQLRLEMENVLANPPSEQAGETAKNRYKDFLEIESLISRTSIAYMTRVVRAGYMYDGKLYSFDTASSGGIKKANCYMMRSDVRKQQTAARWCGSTPNEIVSCGGGSMPATKPLQYQALRKSKAMPIEQVVGKKITTDNCIIVPDKMMRKFAKVGKINEELDFNLAEQEIEIDPFDGIIVALESVIGDIALQLRAEYVKGLAVPFDLIGYCERRHIKPILTDIDGVEHDLSVETNIVFILSQSSWKGKKSFRGAKDWQDKLRSVNRTDIFVCAFDEEEEPDKQLSNQSMQTLIGITQDELSRLAQPTIDELNRFSKPAFARDLIGKTDSEYEDDLPNLAKLVRTYPDVLQTPAAQKELRDRFISRRNKAMYGKLNVNGSFHFVASDMIAWAQVYIEGRDVNDPTIGCLKAGECCCKAFKNGKKLAQLRYPHLFFDWATSVNNTNNSYLKGNVIYKSIHDLDRLIHMSDYDGDHLLVIDDPDLADIAERTRKELDIPVLYFEPLQAKSSKYQPFTHEWIGECLYVGKKMDEIGIRTNLIKSAWSALDLNKGATEINEHIQLIAKLWYLANVSVDAQKTYATVEVPQYMRDLFGQLPSYQRYREASGFMNEEAHQKADEKFAPKGNGVIDRLGDLLDEEVQNEFELDTSVFEFNYRMMIPMDENADVHVYKTVMTQTDLYEALFPEAGFDESKLREGAKAALNAIKLGIKVGLVDFVSLLNSVNGAYWNTLKASEEYKKDNGEDEVERKIEDKRIGNWRTDKERELIVEFVRDGWRQALDNPKTKETAAKALALSDAEVLRIAAKHVISKNNGGRTECFRHIMDIFGDLYSEAVVNNEAALHKIVAVIEGVSEIDNIEYFKLLKRMHAIFDENVTEEYLCKYAAHMIEMRTFNDGDDVIMFHNEDAEEAPCNISDMVPPVKEEPLPMDVLEALSANPANDLCF